MIGVTLRDHQGVMSSPDVQMSSLAAPAPLYARARRAPAREADMLSDIGCPAWTLPMYNTDSDETGE